MNNSSPTYKILIPFSAVYTLLLFLPTIDAFAFMHYTILSWKFNFSIAALLFPAIFPLEASLVEVYEKKVAYYTVFSCYFVIIFFSLLHVLILNHIDNVNRFSFMLSPTLTITLIGPLSYLITTYINLTFLTKLKTRMRSKHFIFRSMICSFISGFVMSLIVQLSLFYNKNLKFIISIIISTVIIKSIATILYVYLAKFLVYLFRYIEEIRPPAFNSSLIRNSGVHLNE